MKMKKIKTPKSSGWLAKVSRILTVILISIVAGNTYHAHAVVGEARMFYNINTTTPQSRVYNVSANTFSAQAATVVGGTPKWVKVVAGTRRNEAVAAYSDTSATSTLRIMYWNGAAWSNAAPHNWTANLSTAAVGARGFDIAVEQLSGDIIVAYTTNAAGTEINFRRWDGATWSAATAYDSTRLTGTVRFIKMESKPDSDDIALIMADTNNDLSAAIWNGTTNAWGNPPAAVLSASTAFFTAAAVDEQSFDLAYESLTGDLLVAWANDAIATGLFYNTFSGGAWGATAQYTNMTENFEQVDCASDPLSDKIICAAVGTATQDMRVGVWDGTAWQGVVTDVDTTGAPATFVVDRKYLSVGWLNAGATKRGIIVYNDNNAAAINWVVVNEDGTFAAQTDNTTATPMPVGGIAYHDIIMDPFNPDRLLFLFQDTTNFDIFAKRLVMDSTPAFTWSDANAGAVITAAPTTAASEAFHLAYDLDITPPAAGTVTVSPDAAGYTSSAPTITTVFTEDYTAVTSCEYTTNGAAWVAGVVSGTFPNYTCTANPTGLTGALTINMRAKSRGGLGTATAISRTVDAAGPTDGTLTVTPGGEQNALSWTAATDSGSGLRTTNTYDVRYLEGATPPTCSTGTSIYLGTGLYTHIELNVGTQYSYRVCAYDNTNNASPGATGTGTPTTYGTGITSCGRCHGNPPVDGTARNTPVGQFPGSHSKHAGTYSFACTKCHVDNTTYNHRNSNINMATPINGDTGASYTKGTSWPQSNVQPFTGGTCSNTYCHSNGTSVATGSIVNNPSPAWAGTVTCNSCHTAPPNYANNTPKKNSHEFHSTLCQKCHNATTTDSATITGTANHANKAYNLVAESGQFNTYSFATGGGTCKTVTCHANQNGQWGVTTFACLDCHNRVITKTLGTGGTLRNVTTDFKRLSRHVSGGTATLIATKWDCIVCHMEGQEAAGTTQGHTNPTNHNDAGGLVNLRNVDFPATGWAINNKSYDEQMRTDQDTFCMTCHDSDGAAGINVNATNNGLNLAPTRALTPFNTSDNLRNGRDLFTTRTRVIDVKGQFFAGTGGSGAGYNGNPSQHAVLGARYSANNVSWTAATWTAQVLKNTSTMNVTRERARLHCSDCHLSEVNAHGAANAWHMLQNRVVGDSTTDFAMTGAAFTSNAIVCWKCHNSAVYDPNVASTATRLSHDTDGDWGTGTYGTGAGESAKLGPACLLCHAGNGFGRIHGRGSATDGDTVTYTPAGATGTYSKYRFMPGAEMEWEPGTGGTDADWNSTTQGSCYFGAASTTWSTCTQHDGASRTGNAVNYARPVKY